MSINLLCFDLNNVNTFDTIEEWVKEILKFEFEGTVLLVGCKSDLEQKVNQKEIEMLSGKYGMRYFKTSSKTGDGFKKLNSYLDDISFEAIIKSRVVIKKRRKE